MAKNKDKQETIQQNQEPSSNQQPPEEQAMQTGGSQQPQQQGQTEMMRRGQGGFSSFPSPALFMTSPFTFMRRFSEEMDRLFEDFAFGSALPSTSSQSAQQQSGLATRSSSGGFGQSMFMPQIEVAQRGDQIIIHADLPGLNKDDVNIEVTDDGLVISGERRHQFEDRQAGVYRSERSYGSFRRLIPLPQTANIENANATFNNGVLEISIPNQQPQASSRRIQIQDAVAQQPSAQARSEAEPPPQQSSAQAAGGGQSK